MTEEPVLLELIDHTFGSDFTTYGPNIGRNGGDGAFTLTKEFCSNWKLCGKASGELWSNAHVYNFLSGFTITW